MAWDWTTWAVSVAAVVVSGALAWVEGNWTRRPGLGMGFVEHGGMWGDLVLLSLANAVIVPHLTVGPWIAVAVVISTVASVAAHIHWYGGTRGPRVGEDELVRQAVTRSARRGEHMWPRRVHGSWARDLSWAGWAHVMYVIGELTLLIGFALHPAPADVVIFVAAIFTIHVPIGLLQPRYFLTGHIATAREQPLLLPLLAALWVAVASKW
jgi:hypothetical protein